MCVLLTHIHSVQQRLSTDWLSAILHRDTGSGTASWPAMGTAQREMHFLLQSGSWNQVWYHILYKQDNSNTCLFEGLEVVVLYMSK